jgi:hypothetical protein
LWLIYQRFDFNITVDIFHRTAGAGQQGLELRPTAAAEKSVLRVFRAANVAFHRRAPQAGCR